MKTIEEKIFELGEKYPCAVLTKGCHENDDLISLITQDRKERDEEVMNRIEHQLKEINRMVNSTHDEERRMYTHSQMTLKWVLSILSNRDKKKEAI